MQKALFEILSSMTFVVCWSETKFEKWKLVGNSRNVFILLPILLLARVGKDERSRGPLTWETNNHALLRFQ